MSTNQIIALLNLATVCEGDPELEQIWKERALDVLVISQDFDGYSWIVAKDRSAALGTPQKIKYTADSMKELCLQLVMAGDEPAVKALTKAMARITGALQEIEA